MQHERPASFNDGAPSGTAAGIAIAFCAIATILAVSHHPTVSAREPAEAMVAMVRVATPDRIVHGALIAMMGALLFGFTVFSLRRGLHRTTSVAGLIAYTAGVTALIGAGLVDGFLIPAMAERYAGAPADVIKTAIQVVLAAALMIQVLSKFGFVAMSIGVAFWSASLVAGAGVVRATGVIGFASAFVTVGFLSFAGHLNPHSLGVIVIVQAVWYLAVATLLIRRQL